MCVCCTLLFSFFPLAFVLVNDLSLVSRCFCFGNAYDFFYFLYALVFEQQLKTNKQTKTPFFLSE